MAMSSLTSLLLAFDLPSFVLVQTLAVLAAACNDILTRPSPPPTATTNTTAKHPAVPRHTAPTEQQQPPHHHHHHQPDNGLRGIATLSLSLTTLLTARHVPIERNQLVHASVPIRLFVLAPLAAWRVWRFPREVTGRARLDMLITVVADLVGGLVTGWYIGNFSGVAAS